MKKKILMLAILTAFMAAARLCFGMAVEDVPNPMQTAGKFVEDAGGVLGPEYVSLIDGICRQLKAKTTAEMAVVTVGDLGGTTVEDFAVKLFGRYGIGKKGKDNGILILFALGDRKVRIEVGYGLEGVINDAKAGRMLDTYAVPRFKAGEFGRGLYDLSMAAASEVASSLNAQLDVAEPAVWPTQIEPPVTVVERETVPAKIENPSQAIGAYLIGVLVFAILGLSLLILRVRLARAKAAKQKAMGGGTFMPTVIWILGAIVMFVIGELSDKILLPVVAYLGSSATATAAQIFLRKHLKNYISSYRLECPKCKTKMDMISEAEDDKLLKTEEVAEEKAGGMNYEFWKCSKCGATERLVVKLMKASDCPKCKRRTVVCATTMLAAATTSQKGRERVEYKCKNPKCDYKREVERSVPKISTSSGGSSGGHSSGGSSFGGGSSGGGGASRGW